MRRTIFYSWQSDLPNSTNRGFIERALQDAARQLAANADLGIEPAIDRDTQGAPGSPDIAHTIFEKIATADVFVADVSLVSSRRARRPAPNPNVLVELGYALRALGHERVILVFNRASGKVDRLPFDLKMRRALLYEATNDMDRGPERARLAVALNGAIALALRAIPAPDRDRTPPSPVELAIGAVEDGRPNRRLAVRKAIESVVASIKQAAPPAFSAGGTAEALKAALAAASPALADLARLADAAAAIADADTAEVLYRGLAPILDCYAPPRGARSSDTRDGDYYKFLGHEYLVTLVAALLADERWELLASILDGDIPVTNHPSGTSRTVPFSYASNYLASLAREGQRAWLHPDLLHERHTTGPLADLIPFDRFVAADYLLYLRGELGPGSEARSLFTWRPWSCLYLREVPLFLRAAERERNAAGLVSVLHQPDVQALREGLRAAAPRLERFWPSASLDQPVDEKTIAHIGTRP